MPAIPKHCAEDREDVLAANEAAVEQREAGERHEEDERGARHHPGVVARARSRDPRGDVRRPRAVVHVGLKVRDPLLKRRFGRLGVRTEEPGCAGKAG